MAARSFAYLFERFPSFVQTFCYREVEEMQRQGMDPLIVSIRHPEDAPEVAEKVPPDILYLPEPDAIRAQIDEQREQRQLPARVHRALPRVRQEKDSNRMFEAAWLGPLLRADGIKHVHAHFGGIAARTAWWLRELYGITYSFTGHANDIFCDSDFPVSNAMLVRDAKFVVTETDYAKQWMEKHHPRSAGRIFRVYNGIDRAFPPRGMDGSLPRILSVGRFVEKKGFSDLIEACRQLRERRRNFECLIVGDGPLEPELREQIDSSHLLETVKLLGLQPQSEVRRLLASSQMFVLACAPESGGGSDNLPTVIMEAMMCSVPVISTRIAGLPEMIQHGENGLLVAPRNPAALSVAIDQLLRDQILSTKLGTRGHGTAVAKFSIENTTRALKHLLVRFGRVRAPAKARELDPTLPRGLFRRWFW